MTYLVTKRANDGTRETVAMEAPDRKALFAELEKSGVKAIRIEESNLPSRKLRKVSRNKSTGKKHFKGLLFAALVALVAVAAIVAWIMLVPREKTENGEYDAVQPPTGNPQLATPNLQLPTPDSQAPKSARDIALEFKEQAKDFIKKAATNEIQWIVPPLDPDDPDNALRTRVCQELGSLLSIEPGEPMPPFPYSFILEDDMREAQANGEDVGEIDNGNNSFFESLEKYKIVAKETDDEHRLEHKEKLLAAQGELLDAIDEGLSVNDTIRAAYEFRKRAYETRTELSNLLQEIASEESDIEIFKEQLKMANQKLEEQGIKTIPLEEILPEYEENEGNLQ